MINITATKLLILLGFAFVSSPVHAQSDTASIEGTVTHNGEPLPGVNISLPDIQKGSVTDAGGNYEINDVPQGNYALRASYVGFKKVSKKVEVTAGETVSINFSMEEAPSELGQMVVTGTMRETYVKDSPVKVEVVNMERLSQTKTSANFMDYVGSVNGLSTQLNCGVCGTNAIRINGVEGPNTAVLIDGMPIQGALASVYGLNGISPSIIDQVEVIKGPQSTLYGTQALGGVVNIITKNPANTPSFSVEAYGESTTREGSLNLTASPEIGRFKGFVSGNLIRDQHYFDNNGDGFNDRPNQTRGALFAKGVLMGKEGEQRFTAGVRSLAAPSKSEPA